MLNPNMDPCSSVVIVNKLAFASPSCMEAIDGSKMAFEAVASAEALLEELRFHSLLLKLRLIWLAFLRRLDHLHLLLDCELCHRHHHFWLYRSNYADDYANANADDSSGNYC